MTKGYKKLSNRAAISRYVMARASSKFHFKRLARLNQFVGTAAQVYLVEPAQTALASHWIQDLLLNRLHRFLHRHLFRGLHLNRNRALALAMIDLNGAVNCRNLCH